jgi:hypothetical protein
VTPVIKARREPSPLGVSKPTEEQLQAFVVYRSGSKISFRHTACGQHQSLPGLTSLDELLGKAMDHLGGCDDAAGH